MRITDDMEACRWFLLVVCGGLLCYFVNGQQPVSPVTTGGQAGITPEDIREAWEQAAREISDRRRIATSGFAGGAPGDAGSAAFGGGGRGAGGAAGFGIAVSTPVSQAASRHQTVSRSGPRSRQMASAQQVFQATSRVLRSRVTAGPQQAAGFAASVASVNIPSIVGDDPLFQECENLITMTDCEWNSRYRTIDGSCNNLFNPLSGMASYCLQRLLDPAYSDGESQLRTSVFGDPLPNARTISLNIHPHLVTTTEQLTHMFMQWGQFLDHDISLSPLYLPDDNIPPQCCRGSTDEECLPIQVESDDPFFSNFGTTCLQNVRSAVCATCTIGPRQQINQLTAYIDASQVYGTDVNQTRDLRTLDGTGKLRSQNNCVFGELLPESDEPLEDQCSDQDPNFQCFQAGDQRVNVQPALTALHTLFLREHNRIAERLCAINPRWDDETVFQEARRILGAQMQMITYNEFVPLIIGRDRTEGLDLPVLRNGYTQYNDRIEADVLTEFSTAAYRFGHSMINSFFPQISADGESQLRLRDTYFYPFELYRGQMERMILGLTDSPAKRSDRYMVVDVTDHLYRSRDNASSGSLDLAAINIMRGRDHGLRPYKDYVRYCGGPDITNFAQLNRIFRRGAIPYFEGIYQSVEDIDLFSGGLAERPLEGAAVGPTFACIIGKQFYRLKYGDRFYFEHGNQIGSFTPLQLQELRKNTLAKIICDNTEIREIQQYVMRFSNNDRNPVLDCRQLPEMDFNAWRQ